MALSDTEFPCLMKKGEGVCQRSCIFLGKIKKEGNSLLDRSQGSRGFLLLLFHTPSPCNEQGWPYTTWNQRGLSVMYEGGPL